VNQISVQVFHRFEQLPLPATEWNQLLREGQTNVVFLTHQWQRAWWDSFGRGELLLTAAFRQGRIVALAPFFYDSGMIYFVGSGGSDYLGFVGDVSDLAVLAALLDAARQSVADFIGFVLYMVPDSSRLGPSLTQVAAALDLQLFDEGEIIAPALDAGDDGFVAAGNKSSLVRHERHFRREGRIDVRHSSQQCEILPQLDDFFEQHVARWRGTPYPSLFLNPSQRAFYRTLTAAASDEGWLRFTQISWNDAPIAFHFGFHYVGAFLWYKPSFEVELARRSPGEVLLRQLLLAATAEGATVFDFGVGDEAFKRRFATCNETVRTWGLYARDKLLVESHGTAVVATPGAR
jgi:CelD/BcsL family acetyltransferase involved in cellulose biosynthesis